MRVLVVSTLYPMHAGDATGSFVESQITALRDQGVDVRLIVPVPFAPPGAGRRRDRWRERTTRNLPYAVFVPTIAVPRAFRLTTPVFNRLGSIQASLARGRIRRWLDGWEPHVVHAHQILPEGQFARKLAASLRWNVPIVATIHGADLHATRSSSRSRLVRHLGLLDHVVVATPSMKESTLTLQPRARVSVIPPGLRMVEPPSDNDAAPRWDVVSVGRLVPIKTMERLFPVAEAGHTVGIAGDGSERRRLEANAPPGIDFVGGISPQEVHDFVGRGRIYAQVSQQDGYGLAAAEAMWCGLPVILADTVGLSEYLTHGVDGMVVPGDDTRSVAEIVSTLLDDPHAAERIGHNGRATIASHSISVVAQRLVEEVYLGVR